MRHLKPTIRAGANMASRLKVYIAGPYSLPDPCENTHKAIAEWNWLWDAGFTPFCPHVLHFLHTMNPRSYHQWLAYDLEWLPTCDVLLRLPGASTGADKEVELADSLNIPVFFSREELLEFGSEDADDF